MRPLGHPWQDVRSFRSSGSPSRTPTGCASDRSAAPPRRQNQALSALLFLYERVLSKDIGRIVRGSHAKMPTRVPVVLSVGEVRAVLAELNGTVWLAGALLYGAGLRLQECLELRVKDVDFERREITIRRGKGQKDRRVMLPDAVRDRLTDHLERVRALHRADLAVAVRVPGRAPLPRSPAGPFGCEDDDGVHARAEPGRAGREESNGPQEPTSLLSGRYVGRSVVRRAMAATDSQLSALDAVQCAASRNRASLLTCTGGKR